MREKLITDITKLAIRNNEDKNCNGRDDFSEFIDRIYKRI